MNLNNEVYNEYLKNGINILTYDSGNTFNFF
jgi:hypothetical protein